MQEAESQGRDGSFDIFQTASEGPEFTIDIGGRELGAGAYRLTIETPDAHLVQDAFLILAPLDETRDERFVRLRLARRPKVLNAEFVVPEGYQFSRFAPVVSQEIWRAASVQFRNISLAEWRLRRLSALPRRWLGSPRRTLSEARQLAAIFGRSGVSGFRQELVKALTGSMSGVETFPFEGFRDTIERRNQTLLTHWAKRDPVLAASDSLSIIVPIYNTPRPWLRQLLHSLDRQTDQSFELVLVFDGEQPDLEAFVRGIVENRAGVAIEKMAKNRGVSAAVNAGIARAGGAYVTVVDHDDHLDRSFVAAFRQAISACQADIYFADEAVTDSQMRNVIGVATRGKFDLRHYLSHPYIVHPVVVRKAVAETAGLFNEAMSVSHDIDFFLRCVAHSRTVVQVPLVLYYWRTHEGSLGHQAAESVTRNTKAAIARFLQSTTNWNEIDVRDGPVFNTFEVLPPTTEGAKVAIVIPTRDNGSLLAACLASVEKRRDSNRANADILVVDHRSAEPATLSFLAGEQAVGRIEVLRDEGPWNYAAINNRAVAAALSKRRYSHIVFMNNDIELVTDDWLDRLLAQFAYGDVGVVGCCLSYPDGRIQHGGVVMGLAGMAEHAYKFERLFEGVPRHRRAGHLCGLTATRDCGAVTAALMIVPSDLFEAVGGFDESLAVGFNDVDLCLRIAERGFATTYVGSVIAVHHESASRPDSGHPEDTRRFRERWGALIEKGDEHYGLLMDWSSPMAAVCLKRQKPFALRRTDLRHPATRRDKAMHS